MRSGLPPKRRWWKRGQAQIGLFVRSPSGSIVEVIADSATTEEFEAAMALVKLLAAPEKKDHVTVDREGEC